MFNHVPSFSPPGDGVFHSCELPFVFNYAPFLKGAGEPQLAQQFVGYWTRFAATGNPNGAGSVTWPQYNTSDEIIVLDITSEGAPHHCNTRDYTDRTLASQAAQRVGTVVQRVMWWTLSLRLSGLDGAVQMCVPCRGCISVEGNTGNRRRPASTCVCMESLHFCSARHDGLHLRFAQLWSPVADRQRNVCCCRGRARHSRVLVQPSVPGFQLQCCLEQ